jgi:metallo-beta-lactamase family protein
VFLVHGEEPALSCLSDRLGGVIDAARVTLPVLDEKFELTVDGARRASEAAEPRLAPERVARLDWHNDLSRLYLDINDAVIDAADERSRDALIRKLRRTLEGGE